jgi:hypothetical protein
MCKSIAEGGQRCATHLRPAYKQALVDYFNPDKSIADATEAVIAFASTPRGAKEIQAKRYSPSTGTALGHWLDDARDEGIRRDNAEIEARKEVQKEIRVRQRAFGIADIIKKINNNTFAYGGDWDTLVSYAMSSNDAHKDIEALQAKAERKKYRDTATLFRKVLEHADERSLHTRISEACLVECNRQGVGPVEHQQLIDTYYHMAEEIHPVGHLYLESVLWLGAMIEPEKASGLRRTPVTFANGTTGLNPDLIPRALESLFAHREDMSVDEFIKEFLIIHPFTDGNGRTAFVLYNLLMDNPRVPVALPNYFGETEKE